MKIKVYQTILVGLLIIISISGCGSTSGYREPITKFNNASSVVINSTKIYLSELNKVERNAYVDKQTSDKKYIKLIDINEKQVFSAEQISARLKALNLLSKYGELLGQLATSDAPERITSNATNLGAALSKLSHDVSGNTEENKTDFSKAIGPVTEIVGVIASSAIERKMKKALDTAITEGKEPIELLIEAIEVDIIIAFQRKRNALTTRETALVDKYNLELEAIKNGTGDPIQLEKNAEELKSLLTIRETFKSSNPTDGFEAMKTAHKALIDYANSDKNEQKFADLIEAMEAFTAKAERIGVAVNQLQNI